MGNLVIRETKDTPGILFDDKNHLLEIKGKSFPEATASFYEPVFSWLTSYLKRLKDEKVMVNIELEFFSSTTLKILMDFFDILDEAAENGKNITVNWIYDQGDDNMLEYGEEFRDNLESLKFNLLNKGQTHKFGQFLIDRGVVDEETVFEALNIQKSRTVFIGRIAQKKGILTIRQILQILNTQSASELGRFGELGVKMGYINDKDILKLLDIQQRTRSSIGDILIEMKKINITVRDVMLKEYHKNKFHT